MPGTRSTLHAPCPSHPAYASVTAGGGGRVRFFSEAAVSVSHVKRELDRFAVFIGGRMEVGVLRECGGMVRCGTRRRDGETERLLATGARRACCWVYCLSCVCCVCFQLGSLALFRPPSQTSGLNCQGNTTPFHLKARVQPSLYYTRQGCLWSG